MSGHAIPLLVNRARPLAAPIDPGALVEVDEEHPHILLQRQAQRQLGCLLGHIGANMIKEACSGDCEEENESLDIRTMFLLAVATSIDALAVGITFAFLDVHLLAAVSFIGITTFTLSAAGVKIGNVFGTRYKAKAELAGGVILILLGLKILLEHLGILTL